MNKPKTGSFPIDDRFDIELANNLARLETYNKHYYRPNTYLHKWWARRCGTTFRLILKHLINQPARQDYYSPGGLEGRIILDPMMGGGTTLHEALRLGANVIGVDLDPIPVLQARATLSKISLDDLEDAYQHWVDSIRRDLAGYFMTSCPHCQDETESWYVLYGARRHCACGEVLVVDSYLLREESDGSQIRLCPTCKKLSAESEPCRCRHQEKVKIIERGTTTCPHCREKYKENIDLPYFSRYEPIAVSGHCPEHKLFLRSPDPSTLSAISRANAQRPSLPLSTLDFIIEPGSKSSNLTQRGVHSYLDLFTSRQLLVLVNAVERLPQAEQLRLNLSLLLSTSLEFNALLCGYKGKSPRRPGAIRHAFARHAYSIPYTALENNPLYPRKSSGTWQTLFHSRIRRARKWALQPRERLLKEKKPSFIPIPGEEDQGIEVSRFSQLKQGSRRFLLQQASASQLELPDDCVDAIVTDPPYFDSVQYSDLSAYFRVWLQQMLPDEANWSFDATDSAVSPNHDDQNNHYTALISQIFSECFRVLNKDHGRLIFTYHHWNPMAWTSLAVGLKDAGFMLLNWSVVHSENPISVHIANMNALIHDTILVLAPCQPPVAGRWEKLEKINKNSSEQFTGDCAELLGWMLQSSLTAEEITLYWQKAINY